MTSVQIADSLFSRYARISRSDKHGAVSCVICGSVNHWGAFDCGHFVVRSNMALRFDLDNCWPVCRVCHSKDTHSSEYEAALLAKKGQGFVDELRRRGAAYFRAQSDEEIKALINELKSKLTVYGN